MQDNPKFLFLVVLGGKAPNANVEVHDVRWVIGSKIDDTFSNLRKNWFGLPEGLHIDSYKKIISVDGFKVSLKVVEKKMKVNNKSKKVSKPNMKLWFVNIGGYNPNTLQEKHEFGLVVAPSSSKAKNIAKSKWLIAEKKRHNDNISYLNLSIDVDDCKVIKNIDEWEIELSPQDFIVENNKPDWFGYMRIDKNTKNERIKKLN